MPAYPAGLEVGRTLVAIGRSTDDGSELWLAPNGGPARVIYRHPDPAGVDALTRDDELLVLSHSEHGDPRYPALRVLRTADNPSSPRSGTARGADCTPWSSARCPATGASWWATSGAVARSC